ncbi:MAG TPA: uroporphyrinogen-III synthase, partial [Arenimonas sp.]|nr:uroporphyrinogen-III synthase [Arenimonas sp.]
PQHGANSESLLAMPELQGIAGRTVGLVTAPGGRGVIATTLRERGAALHVAEVYRRQPRQIPSARLDAALRLPPHTALLVSSGEAFDVAWTQWPPALRARLQRQPAVASSPRLRSKLQAQGFVKVRLAEDAQPRSLLAAVSQHAAALSLPVR